MKNNRYTNWFFAAAVVVAGFSMAACEDEPDKYEVAGGKPTLKYVRVPDPAAADSLLTGAYMANTICLVGENLRSVYELYFNDQKAILNTSYITDHTLMVDVPAMFNYFKTEGLDNLIWVWTTEGNDADWYPGDQYVDIVGRDVYNKETADCVSEYTSIAENYGNKIVSLSECGTVGLISEQWASGARWSWFMPWYDGTNEDGSPVVHADEAWWKDAMSQEFVVSREELPSME